MPRLTNIRVLVGMECSARIRDAFREIGIDAWSCDIKPCEGDPAWHLCADVFTVLDRGWDLGIFHPECRYLCSSGLHWNARRPERATLTEQAFDFVMRLKDEVAKNIPHWAIENSVGCLSTRWRKPDQIIQPHQFGHDASKATALWLHDLPLLNPTLMIRPKYACVCGHRFDEFAAGESCPSCGCTTVSKKQVWGNQTPSGQNKLGPSATRSADRARTYIGIARAIAYQWGTHCLNERNCNHG